MSAQNRRLRMRTAKASAGEVRQLHAQLQAADRQLQEANARISKLDERLRVKEESWGLQKALLQAQIAHLRRLLASQGMQSSLHQYTTYPMPWYSCALLVCTACKKSELRMSYWHDQLDIRSSLDSASPTSIIKWKDIKLVMHLSGWP